MTEKSEKRESIMPAKVSTLNVHGITNKLLETIFMRHSFIIFVFILFLIEIDCKDEQYICFDRLLHKVSSK